MVSSNGHCMPEVQAVLVGIQAGLVPVSCDWWPHLFRCSCKISRALQLISGPCAPMGSVGGPFKTWRRGGRGTTLAIGLRGRASHAGQLASGEQEPLKLGDPLPALERAGNPNTTHVTLEYYRGTFSKIAHKGVTDSKIIIPAFFC